ncbi:MAG TPA: 7-carboxy-7-deazaguanine synthase QueE [Flavobacteriales bacterium]|nr:7-carboxy-7-deazaguanine synthase QueE [Flavobacteriales bacterium]|tara:strand:- start:21996 stop:22631 length:636 start_codon:yes stop_codon:yes gene_type:complete
MINAQQQELLDKGLLLPVMEQFYTIQGEGYHTGKAAYFIRVGGCDVGCHWCDVKESWNPDLHPLTEISKVLSFTDDTPAKTVVITGGEPLMYNMNPLTRQLKEKGMNTHIETSGAYPLSGTWDWICLSPKKTKHPLPEILQQANELKIIVHNCHDFKWAEEFKQKVNEKCLLYLQPEWSKKDEIIPQIIEYVQQNPEWSISLQTHKYLNIP